MGLARVKAYWTDMDDIMIASQDPVGGQYPAGHYLAQVMEGARLIEARCPKNLLFE